MERKPLLLVPDDDKAQTFSFNVSIGKVIMFSENEGEYSPSYLTLNLGNKITTVHFKEPKDAQIQQI